MKHALALAGCLMLGLAGAAEASPADAVPQGRLPDDVTPTRYHIDLTVLPDQPRFTGHVEIEAHLNRATDHFFMHGLGLGMHKAYVLVGGVRHEASYIQVDPLGVVRIDLPQALPPADLRLVFDFDAPVGDTTAGIFRVHTDGQWYAWSHFEPLDARRAFPGFDQPGYKTPFDISITTSPGLIAVSNAPETGTEPVGKLVRHHFAPTLPLPTYLTAFYVGPFATLSGTLQGGSGHAAALPVRVVGEQRYRAQLPYVLENSKAILLLLEDYFGQPFPFPKLDQVGTPLLNGGMENAGADLYGASVLFVDKTSAPAEQGYFGELVAHELAHQWFGDLVTPQWWDDLWLNESFANWMGYRISSQWRPDLAFGTKAVADALEAMDIDALDVGRAIHQPIERSEEAAGAFDDITYAKGGQVIAMMAAYMGDATFRDAVRLHLNRHRYGNASAVDFFQALADAAHDPRLAAAMQGFVDQQGVPLITVHREAGRVWISQTPYVARGATTSARTWLVPVCWREVPVGSKHCVLLDKPSMTLPEATGTVVLPNAGGSGYYRYDMGEADWMALIAQAHALHPAEALTLVDSAWAAFHAGRLKFGVLLELTAAMAGHAYEPVSVDSANRLLAMKRQGFVDASTASLLDRFVSGIYRPRLAELGFDPRAHAYDRDTVDRRQRRHDLVGVLRRAGDDSTIQALAVAAEARLHGDAAALATEYLDDAFHALVVRRGLDGAKRLWTLASSSSDERVRRSAWSAIAQSDQVDVAQWITSQLDAPRLRPVERVAIVLGLLAQPATRSRGEQQALSRFSQLEDRTGHYGEVLLGAPKVSCDANAARNFGTNMLKLAAAAKLGTLDIQRGMALAQQCDALRQAQGRNLAEGIRAVTH
ncbi:M1 family metallopeptidase [Dyella telluris]|uniref:Aminopeptidase n=1 Tax=Dyella telluris TaxID=2763498 RepID=A0A7G8Q3Q8_9GAMM|nr:M1 family metallopeptidase [Dyella telluris]QNK01416.1 M1 family metallopeptidase [Dyella telluris]